MPVEPLEFGKEVRVRKMTVENADRVVRIVGDPQIPANRVDRAHVARCHISGSSYQRKRQHQKPLRKISTLPQSG